MSSENITVCPSYKGTQLDVRKRGTRYRISYWKGFEKIHVNGDYTNDDDLEKIKQKCLISKNKNTDTFVINKSDITPQIMKYFRYIQPSIPYDKQEILIDPYILGSWLGDGSSDSLSITNIDKQIIQYWSQYAQANGMRISMSDKRKRVNDAKDHETDFIATYNIVGVPFYHIKVSISDYKVYEVKTTLQEDAINKINKIFTDNGIVNLIVGDRFFLFSESQPANVPQRYIELSKYLKVVDRSQYKNKLRTIFKNYNLLNNKHIPQIYLENDYETRLALLAGLLDTDGCLICNGYDLIQKNKILSDQIVTLCLSLGFNTSISECKKACMYKGERREGTYYRIAIQMDQFSKSIPILLDRKRWVDTGKGYFNKKLTVDGDLQKKIKNNWSEELDIKLYSYVESFKHIEQNKPILWKTIQLMDDDFKSFSSAALETRYRKVLSLRKDKLEELRIPLVINPKMHRISFATKNK